jgi:hypothetical protein
MKFTIVSGRWGIVSMGGMNVAQFEDEKEAMKFIEENNFKYPNGLHAERYQTIFIDSREEK